jgi:arylsulfatase A-like enzyme
MRARALAAVAATAALGGGAALLPTSSAVADHHHQIKHVLLISIDGMHQSDLEWYIANHPNSELAKLASGGAEFSNNHAADPSDSDPGGTAIMTGGDPRATGVYYDVEYSHAVDEAGASCTPGQPATGGDVIYDSPDDKLNAVPDFLGGSGTFPSFDADGTIYNGLNNVDTTPAAIMNMTPTPQTALNAGSFPVDPATCNSIMPWDYLKVNSIFGVIHNAGLRTAWSDKHSIYTSFNGAGSNGHAIDDFFGPEIDSQAVMPNGVPYTKDDDWAHIDAATKQYDGYKVQAILNEIDGLDHSGTHNVGVVPAIFGMNFQTVSVAQKVDGPQNVTCTPLPVTPSSTCTAGPTDLADQLAGYYPGGTTPRPLLASAFDYVNEALQQMDSELQKEGLAGSTAIIITAKHGQSPQDPLLLKRIKDGPIIGAINEAWCEQQNLTATPDPTTYCTNGLKAHTITPLIVAGTDDDLWQSYLSVKTQAAADFVKSYLWNHSAPAVLYNNDGVNRGTVQVAHSGLAKIYAGDEVARFFGVPYSDPRYPDVFGRAQIGTVYTGGGKIAEHGGDNPGDRDVPLVVYAPGAVPRSNVHKWVETTQVAPTILDLLGLDPNALQAVQIEGTRVLPGIGG